MIYLLLASLILMALGAFGIYLAMTSPVQLQPIPAIVFAAGFVMAVFSAGWLLA